MPGGFCFTNTGLCLGAGYCVSFSDCGSSGSAVCGCNGVTYPNSQTACQAGVRVAGDFPCGEPIAPSTSSGGGTVVVYCGASSMCPSGPSCCAITGRCYDASEPALCAFPPPGTSAACVDDSQCGGGGCYCARTPSACSGPGGCVCHGINCSGELAPVCGCDGKSYTNADCAAAAGTNAAYSGSCT